MRLGGGRLCFCVTYRKEKWTENGGGSMVFCEKIHEKERNWTQGFPSPESSVDKVFSSVHRHCIDDMLDKKNG